MWAMGKPARITNYSLDSVKVSGFFALNGTSVIERIPDTKASSITQMLEAVRAANGDRPVVMILDNASNHHSRVVTARAAELGITLAFLPPYSPKLNPIEQIWKCVKREVSRHFIVDLDELFWLIRDVFLEKARVGKYAEAWKRKFLTKKTRNRIAAYRVS